MWFLIPLGMACVFFHHAIEKQAFFLIYVGMLFLFISLAFLVLELTSSKFDRIRKDDRDETLQNIRSALSSSKGEN